jgi:hypothetical protein
VFPILIGCVIGGVGAACIKRFHIRHSIYCGISGLLAGALAMLAMHYFDFRAFQDELRARIEPGSDELFAIARNVDEITAPDSDAPQELQDFAVQLKQDPLWLRALQVESLFDYLDFQAENGVEIGRGVGGGGQGNINLGYVGSYIYWLIEAGLVAGFAFGIMKASAAEPYCIACSQWKRPYMMGFYANPSEIHAALKEGRLEQWTPTELGSEPLAKVTLTNCPTCLDEAPIDVVVEQVTKNKKGEVATKRLGRLTYPAGSFAPLVAALGMHSQVEAAEVEAVEADEA